MFKSRASAQNPPQDDQDRILNYLNDIYDVLDDIRNLLVFIRESNDRIDDKTPRRSS